MTDLAGRELPPSDSPGMERIVHEEIARLPESFRTPIVLCCLQGLSYDLAARRLGVSEPTLRGRLHRARKRLASRLRQRGVTTAAIARAIKPSSITLLPLPSSLLESTVHFSMRWISIGGLLTGTSAVPDAITALAQGAMQTMLFHTIKLSVVAAVFSAGVVGAAVLAQQSKKASGEVRGTPPASPATPAREKPSAQESERKQQGLADRTLRNRQLLQKLDQRIDAEFPDGVTLDQLLKHIKQATTDEHYPGIPIYVSPVGMQEAGHDMKDGFTMKSKQQSVREVLWWALHPLKLSFMVRDGYLVIDSRTSVTEQRVEEMEKKLDRLIEAVERLGRDRSAPTSR